MNIDKIADIQEEKCNEIELVGIYGNDRKYHHHTRELEELKERIETWRRMYVEKLFKIEKLKAKIRRLRRGRVV